VNFFFNLKLILTDRREGCCVAAWDNDHCDCIWNIAVWPCLISAAAYKHLTAHSLCETSL